MNEFREYMSVRKSESFRDVRKKGGGAKEQERRRKQLEKQRAKGEGSKVGVRDDADQNGTALRFDPHSIPGPSLSGRSETETPGSE